MLKIVLRRTPLAGHYWDLPVASDARPADTMAWVRDVCLSQLAPSWGYAVEEHALGGAVEGAVLVVRRGPFRLRCVVLDRPPEGPDQGRRHRLTVVGEALREEPLAARGVREGWAAPAALAGGGVCVGLVTAALGALLAGGLAGGAMVAWALSAAVGSVAGALVARGILSAAQAWTCLPPGRPQSHDDLRPRVANLLHAIGRAVEARALPAPGGFRREAARAVQHGVLRHGRTGGLAGSEALDPAAASGVVLRI